MTKRIKGRVWRLQRDRIYPDTISAMTHDRKLVLHFTCDPWWAEQFGDRTTFYAWATLGGPPDEPRLVRIRETTEEDWK